MSSDPTSYRSNQRSKVYAGRRRAVALNTGVPSLLQICQTYVQQHVDQLEEVGDVPFHLLSPIFETCSVDQLERITSKNPRLEEDLDSLWEKHTRKIFHKDAMLKKRETWWRAYRRLCRERNERLRSITSRINQQREQASAAVKGTQISEVINPANMQKKQLRNGLQPTIGVTDALKMSRSRRAIFNTGSKEELRRVNAEHPLQITPGLTTRVSNGAINKPGAPKIGALMAKSLRMMKSRRR